MSAHILSGILSIRARLLVLLSIRVSPRPQVPMRVPLVPGMVVLPIGQDRNVLSRIDAHVPGMLVKIQFRCVGVADDQKQASSKASANIILACMHVALAD